MMSLLVRDYVLPHRRAPVGSDVPLSVFTENWSDYQEWMRLAIGERSKGVSYTAIRRRDDGSGYLAWNRVRLDLEVLGDRRDFYLETVAVLDDLFRLSQASARMRLDGSEMRFEALVVPGRLFYRWRYEGQTRVGSQPLDSPLSLLEAVRPLAARRLRLKVGRVYRLPVLDSTWSLRQGQAEMRVAALERIRIGGRRLRAYRIEIRLGPFSSTTWVDRKGEVLKRALAGKVVMERIEPDEARKIFPAIDAPPKVAPLKPADFRRGEVKNAPPSSEVGPFGILSDLFGSSGP